MKCKIKNDEQIKNRAFLDGNGNYLSLVDGWANWKERKNHGVNFSKVMYMLGSEELKTAHENNSLRIDPKTGEVFVDSEIAKKYFLKSNRMTECGLRLGYKIDIEGAKRLHNAYFCRERLCPICMWRLSRRLAWETNLIMKKYMAENPDMIPILITLTVKNPRMGELSQMLDVICNGKSGAWQLLSKWLSRRGIKDYVRTLEVTLNAKAQTWHPHLHILAFVPKDYFKKGNKNYISHSLLREEWQHVCKLDYTPVVDIRRCYNKNSENERIDFDSDFKAVDFTAAVKETSKYCVKPLNLFSDEFDDYNNNEENTGKLDVKAVVRELAEALAGRRLRSLGGEIKKIARELKLNEDESKKDLIHKDENGTAEAIWEEIYEYVFEDKDYYLTAREAVEQNQQDRTATERNFAFSENQPADAEVGKSAESFKLRNDAEIVQNQTTVNELNFKDVENNQPTDIGVGKSIEVSESPTLDAPKVSKVDTPRHLKLRQERLAEIRNGAEFSKDTVVGKPVRTVADRFEGVEGRQSSQVPFSSM